LSRAITRPATRQAWSWPTTPAASFAAIAAVSSARSGASSSTGSPDHAPNVCVSSASDSWDFF
jgi:hypothetical protein